MTEAAKKKNRPGLNNNKNGRMKAAEGKRENDPHWKTRNERAGKDLAKEKSWSKDKPNVAKGGGGGATNKDEPRVTILQRPKTASAPNSSAKDASKDPARQAKTHIQQNQSPANNKQSNNHKGTQMNKPNPPNVTSRPSTAPPLRTNPPPVERVVVDCK
jgi:hypothetical protein